LSWKEERIAASQKETETGKRGYQRGKVENTKQHFIFKKGFKKGKRVRSGEDPVVETTKKKRKRKEENLLLGEKGRAWFFEKKMKGE